MTTFHPGDLVRFNDEYWPTVETLNAHDWIKKDRIYTIKDAVYIQLRCDRSAAGHDQHVNLVEDPRTSLDGYPQWSGAFFEPVKGLRQ